MPPELLEPTVDPTAPPPADPDPLAAAPAVEDEAAQDAAIDAEAIEIPGGDKLVPLSALAGARARLRAERAEKATLATKAEQAAQLESQVADLRRQLEQVTPYVQAFTELQRQAQAPKGPTAEETAELEEIATDLQLYTAEGTLDLPRAQRVRDREQRTAERIAKAHVEPIARTAVARESQGMLARALVTAAPNGHKPDPAILRNVWGRLDPALTATPEGALQAWNAALGLTAAMTTPAAPTSRETLPPPLVTERAGGRTDPPVFTMTEGDRRAAKAAGLTEAEYMKAAASMPWRK
jgi:hypothetical protein